MKKNFLLLLVFSIGLISCNPQIDFKKYVPKTVDNFATDFIKQIHKGEIDTCMKLVLPEMNNEKGRQFLTNVYSNIRTYSIDSFRIISARKNTLFGSDGFTNYGIDYEYNVGNKFLYFTFGIKEQNNKLTIIAFDGTIMEDSLEKVNAFTFKDKGFIHFMFLGFAILIPVFIIITLIFAIRTKLNKKWLWIIGILFGFIQFSLNWTTGQFGFKLINISILGAGIAKGGNVAPWIISFSLPIIGIYFWYKRYWDKRETEAQMRLDERMKEQENLDNKE